MGKKNKKKYSYVDIWGNANFKKDGCGERRSLAGKIKFFKECVKWSHQRVERGYAECDVWGMNNYLDAVIGNMLRDLKESNDYDLERKGLPRRPLDDDEDMFALKAEIERNYAECVERDRWLGRMIRLWREQQYGELKNEPELADMFKTNAEYRQWCRDEFFSLMSEHYDELTALKS